MELHGHPRYVFSFPKRLTLIGPKIHTHHEPPKINKSNFVNLIFRFIYIAREEFGQSTWDKVSYFREHMKEHHGKYNEEPM